MRGVVFAFVLFFLFSTVQCLVIATYNIWNTMFSWNIRKLRLLEMIKTEKIDVIALQEVRNGSSGNQLLEIKAALPAEYKWHVFKDANKVLFPEDAIDKSLQQEGIGLISRLPIVESSVSFLIPYAHDPDKNRRLIVHARIKVLHTQYHIIVVHLSYSRQQQCRNIADIIKYINRQHIEHAVILGDFNTYNDYEWPVKLLTENTRRIISNLCHTVIGHRDTRLQADFKDVWSTTHNVGLNGLTFSNMPSPGLESRPDRILVSHTIRAQSSLLQGDGSRYKERYIAAIHWHRFKTILQSARMSYHEIQGFPCLQDCGPHGSCKCGVCVNIGNGEDCRLPNCTACDADVYVALYAYACLSVIPAAHLLISVLLVLTVAANSYGNTLYSILGFNCCLFNPDLCKSFQHMHSVRRRRVLRCLQCWPIFRLAPYLQLLVGVIFMYVFYLYTYRRFGEIIDLTYKVMPEELFPSDHLMLVANITKRSLTDAH